MGRFSRQNRSYRRFVGNECERCGFNAEHRCQMDIHHRDGDHRNNDPANLATLCANCHRLFHLGPRAVFDRGFNWWGWTAGWGR